MINSNYSIQQTAAIIVTYRPEVEQLIGYIENLLLEVEIIILIQNDSQSHESDMIRMSAKKMGVEVITNNTNLGLAHAQNQGIQLGLKMGAEYILLLDEDSELLRGSVLQLKKAFNENSRLGIAACHVKHRGSNKIQKYWLKRNSIYVRRQFSQDIGIFENVNTVISSGSLISRRTILDCGLMRDDYFIDYIDIEYCLRVRNKGYTITVVKSAEIFHKIGNMQHISVGGLDIYPTNHSPVRRYFMVRNRVWTWRAYGNIFPYWLCIDLGNFVIDTARLFLLERNKIENIKYFLKGLSGGLFVRQKLNK